LRSHTNGWLLKTDTPAHPLGTTTHTRCTQQVKFLVPGLITSWACVSLMDQQEVDLAPGHSQSLGTFTKELVNMCNSCGMRCVEPVIVHFDRSCDAAEHIRYAVAEAEKAFSAKCQLVLVLLPSKGKVSISGWGGRVWVLLCLRYVLLPALTVITPYTP